MILAMARPDERKNIESLVELYGKSKSLQDAANLVLVLGCREDLREMPSGQRKVLQNILTLIDVYDLYGKVAYPKSHQPADSADIYRVAAKTKVVFVNPALTEPFGLTLLEAAASGLPIVATDDGGPKDIIANCKNGLLVDPLNSSAIESALLKVISGEERWEQLQQAGLAGVREHYDWESHARRYLQRVSTIIESTAEPAIDKPTAKRQLPAFDRLLMIDADADLAKEEDALTELRRTVESCHDSVGIRRASERRCNLLRLPSAKLRAIANS